MNLSEWPAETRLKRRRVRCPKPGTAMRLFSSSEALVERILVGYPTLPQRLCYFASLRDRGELRHWGLEREFGESASRAALNKARQECLLRVLKEPLSNLWRGVTELEPMQPDVLSTLMSEMGIMPNLDHAQRAHLKSVAAAFAALHQAGSSSGQVA